MVLLFCDYHTTIYLDPYLSFLFLDMQIFDTVRVVGMTPDNVSVIEIIRLFDHDEVLTPGKLVTFLFLF